MKQITFLRCFLVQKRGVLAN